MGRVKERYMQTLFLCNNCAYETEHAFINGHWTCLECKRLEQLDFDREYEKDLDNEHWF